MKAIITVETNPDFWQRARAVARRLDANATVPPQDYQLSFATELQVFDEIYPAALAPADGAARPRGHSVSVPWRSTWSAITATSIRMCSG